MPSEAAPPSLDRRRVLLWFLLGGAFLAPYILLWFNFLIPRGLSFWWSYILAAIAILLVARQLWPGQTLSKLGLTMSWRALLGTVLLTAGFAILVRGLTLAICRSQGIGFDTTSIPEHSWVTPFFQSLSEEIVFRALLLTWLASVMKGRVRAALLSSLIFSGAHWVFYFFYNGVFLTPATLISLFAFSLVTALLYLRFGHIGYSYALHLGWNLTQLEGNFYGVYQGQSFWLTEGQVFLLLEGSPQIVALSLVLLLISTWLWLRRPRQENGATGGHEEVAR